MLKVSELDVLINQNDIIESGDTSNFLLEKLLQVLLSCIFIILIKII